MESLRITYEDKYSEEMELLRQEAYYVNSKTKAIDKFDKESEYLCFYKNDTLIASSRLTLRNPSVWDKWIIGGLEVPKSSEYSNLSRVCIKKSFRGKGLFSLLMVESLCHAIHFNSKNLLAAVENKPFKIKKMESLFWEKKGNEVVGENPPNGIITGQFFVCDLENKHDLIIKKRIAMHRSMLSNGLNIII